MHVFYRDGIRVVHVVIQYHGNGGIYIPICIYSIPSHPLRISLYFQINRARTLRVREFYLMNRHCFLNLWEATIAKKRDRVDEKKT